MCVRVDDVECQIAVGRRHVQQKNNDEVEKVVDEFHSIGDGQGMDGMFQWVIMLLLVEGTFQWVITLLLEPSVFTALTCISPRT